MLSIDATSSAPLTNEEILAISHYGLCPHLCGIEGVCTKAGLRNCDIAENRERLWRIVAAFMDSGDDVLDNLKSQFVLEG